MMLSYINLFATGVMVPLLIDAGVKNEPRTFVWYFILFCANLTLFIINLRMGA